MTDDSDPPDLDQLPALIPPAATPLTVPMPDLHIVLAMIAAAGGHDATALSDRLMSQPDTWPMIRRRAAAVGIHAPIGNHSFRATGITAYLANGGALEHAQQIAAHESPRTTKLYDRTKERFTQDEVERIR
jgi:hypothetical protein